MVAGGLVTAADAFRQADLVVDGQEGGLADFLKVELKIATLAVWDRGFGCGAVGLFEEGRRRVHGRSGESGGRGLGGGAVVCNGGAAKRVGVGRHDRNLVKVRGRGGWVVPLGQQNSFQALLRAATGRQARCGEICAQQWRTPLSQRRQNGTKPVTIAAGPAVRRF